MNTALIGCGYWGKNYLRLLQTSDYFNLTHIIDKNIDQFDDKYVFINDISKLKKGEIDCAIICTPTSTHYEITKKLLKMEINTLVEKPLATSSEQVRELHSLAEENNVNLMTDYTFLYNPVIKKIIDTINQNDLGKLQYLQFERSNLGPIRTDVSVVWDLLTHDISILGCLINENPIEINSSGLIREDNKFHDVVNVSINFSEVFVNCFTSWLHPEKTRQIRIVGDKKMIVFDDLNSNEPLKILDKKISSYDEKEFSNSSYFNFKVGDTFIPFIQSSEPLRNVLDDFENRIENKDTNPLNSKELTLWITHIMEKVLSDLDN